MSKSLLFRHMVTGVLSAIILYGILAPQTILAETEKKPTLVKDGRLTICKLNPLHYEVVKTIKMMVTAYSSTPDQTDDSPFITASGDRVRDGIIAINGLKFGTLVRIPDISGDKVYVVKDRMHSRKGPRHADIWLSSREEAIDFGAKIANIEILES